jgi:PAS domain S-box-containing protein
MHALPDGVLVADRQGTIVFVNTRMEDLSDYRRDDLIGVPVQLLIPDHLHLVHERHRVRFQRYPIVRPMGTGLDLRLRRRDGSLLSVDIHLTAITLDGQQFFVAAIRDISARKQMEDVVRDNEERFRTLVDTLPLAVSTLSRNGVFTSLNKAFETMTGFRREHWIGKHFVDIVHPEDISTRFGVIRRIVARKPVEPRQTRVLTHSGEYRVLESLVVPLMRGGVVEGTLVVSRDVTELAAAEQAVRHGEERFRKVFEDGPLGIILVDLDQRITDVNAAMCQMLDYSRDDLVGTAVESITHPEDRRIDAERSRELVNDQVASYQVEKRWQARSGAVVTTVTSSLIRDPQGAPLYGVQIVEDVSEEKRLEEERATHANKARQALSRLTARQSEVMELATEGLTASEMAERLFVSVRTVESHLAGAYRKLGVRSRQEATSRFDELSRVLADGTPLAAGSRPTD